MSVRVRFAPSPTGRLHVGNIYVALNNWLFARQRGGSFLLRLDDTDIERSTAEFAAGIEADLAWLGLAWDLFARQSQRLASYDSAAARLKQSGRLYPCYETAEELALKRKVQLSQGKPPVYDRAALKLTDSDRARLEAAGITPHWRFRLEGRRVEWHDHVRGAEHIDTSSQSDPVLIRADGTYLYTLPSVVDDIELGVSHVIRGNDHVTNTATQIQIFEALGAKAPEFAHLPLLVDAAGEGLSKRLGSLSIADLRAQGLEPMALNAYLAHIGTGDPVLPVRHLDELVAGHDLAKFGKSSPRFDPVELLHLNARLLHLLPFAEAQAHLASLGLGSVDAALWDVARSNVEKVEEVAEWYRICRGTIPPQVTDPAFAGAAADVLPPEPWDEGTWKSWTDAVKAATGRKGKDLFMPLRLALTGLDHGPELKLLLPLIGRDKALRRLRGESA
ncbi:glutamyl-tRNA synthetase [Dongia mobilis]|uniref:Glutamate--tRNA ligase n=2 Tax=Dongia mobilis TaxID=578943 RepID=A0A4R6WH21_9PROT|nr:glutamate--tRNA ligase [Dongia mobilis]TDQ77611.1 glutamyl-tRNA synthetase [Dongia mobilis]